MVSSGTAVHELKEDEQRLENLFSRPSPGSRAFVLVSSPAFACRKPYITSLFFFAFCLCLEQVLISAPVKCQLAGTQVMYVEQQKNKNSITNVMITI